jgi:hypothetical protein
MNSVNSRSPSGQRTKCQWLGMACVSVSSPRSSLARRSGNSGCCDSDRISNHLSGRHQKRNPYNRRTSRFSCRRLKCYATTSLLKRATISLEYIERSPPVCTISTIIKESSIRTSTEINKGTRTWVPAAEPDTDSPNRIPSTMPPAALEIVRIRMPVVLRSRSSQPTSPPAQNSPMPIARRENRKALPTRIEIAAA